MEIACERQSTGSTVRMTQDAVRQVANARRRGRTTLQSGSERKAEDSSAVSIITNDQHAIPPESEPDAVAHQSRSSEDRFTVSDPPAV